LALGLSYDLDFWYGLGASQQFHGDACILSVTLNGDVIGEAINLSTAPVGQFSLARRRFTADTSIKIVRFEFNCGAGIGEVDVLLDRISLTLSRPDET
jgi:hypothetical protein